MDTVAKNEKFWNIRHIQLWHILLFILIIIFISSRTIFIVDNYKLPLWDESVYMGMGKFIYSSGNSGLWESIRPIGLPLITGIGWLLGNQVLFSEILAVAFSATLILLTYYLSYILSKDHRVSFIAALLLILSPIFFYNSGLILTEIPSTALMIASIISFLIYQKNMSLKKNMFLIISGVFAALATLFRFQQGMILIVLILSIIYNNIKSQSTEQKKISLTKNKQLITNNQLTKNKSFKKIIIEILFIMTGFIIIIAPFLIFNIFAYSQYTNNIFDATFRPLILGSMHQANVFESVIDETTLSYLYNIFYYIIALVKSNILFLLWIPAIIFIKDKEYFALKAMSILMLLYLTYIINKQERFLIMILPIISIMAASIIFAIYDGIKPKPKSKSKSKKYVIEKNINKDIKHIWSYIGFSIIAGIFVFSMILYISTNKGYYYWEYKEKPEIVEYYKYIESNNIKGPILITDPVFATYTDERLIPFYDTIKNDYSNKDSIYLNLWEKDYDINAIAYSEYAFPCTAANKNECKEFKINIKKEIEKNYDLAYEKQHNGFYRYIFVKK